MNNKVVVVVVVVVVLHCAICACMTICHFFEDRFNSPFYRCFHLWGRSRRPWQT